MDDFYQFIEKFFVPAVLPIIIATISLIISNKSNLKAEKAINNSAETMNNLEKHNDNSKNELDVLVVPAGGTWEFINKYKIYFRKKTRSFQNVEYIAFYKDKYIEGYAEFEKVDFSSLSKEIQNKYNSYNFEEDNAFYKLKNYKTINYPWIKKGKSVVQNQQYISLDEIKNK